MIRRNIILSCTVFLLTTVWLVPMGEQEQASVSKEPAFSPLEEEEDLFNGRIKDDQKITEVTQLSFFGHTKIGGIRRDDDDSVTTLNLANIKSIKIQQHMYTSKKYPDKDFALVQKTALDGTVTDGLLLPRQVIVCGIEKKTGDEKAWYLSKIDELIIEPGTVAEPQAPAGSAPAAKLLAQATMPEMPTTQGSATTETSETTTDQLIAKAKEKYKAMQIKIVEKEPDVINKKKTVIQAVTDLFAAIIEVIKALFNFVKGLFW